MNDLASLAPATVLVAFPATGSGAPASKFLQVPVTLASLNLTQFKNISGAPWKKLLHRYEVATYGSDSSASNSSTLTSLATRIATDWYLWQLASLDKYFVGTAAWQPEGFHDVEWRQSAGRITTHVQRRHFNPSEDLIYGAGSTGDVQQVCEPNSKDVVTCVSLIQDEDDNVIGIEVGRQQMTTDQYGCVTWGPMICQINPDPCCEPPDGSGGVDSWWCVEVQSCADSSCVNCEAQLGVECVQYDFGAVGVSRCVLLAGTHYRRETAIKGPFDTKLACVAGCGGIITACCGIVPQSLCALLSDGGGMSCANGLGIDLGYFGVANVPCDPSSFDCISCHGLTGPTWKGYLEVCGHVVILTLSCGSDGQWYAKIVWEDGCGSTQYFSDCNGSLAVLQCTPLFHLRFAVIVPDGCTDSPPPPGDVTVGCCVDPISELLTATVTSKTGTCSCIADSFTLTYDAVAEQWNSPTICSSGFSVSLKCIELSPGVYEWRFGNASVFATTTLISEDCPPTFEQVWDCDGSPITCTGTCTITITE